MNNYYTLDDINNSASRERKREKNIYYTKDNLLRKYNMKYKWYK